MAGSAEGQQHLHIAGSLAARQPVYAHSGRGVRAVPGLESPPWLRLGVAGEIQETGQEAWCPAVQLRQYSLLFPPLGPLPWSRYFLCLCLPPVQRLLPWPWRAAPACTSLARCSLSEPSPCSWFCVTPLERLPRRLRYAEQRLASLTSREKLCSTTSSWTAAACRTAPPPHEQHCQRRLHARRLARAVSLCSPFLSLPM